MELRLTRGSVHAADDVAEVHPQLPEDANLGDLVDWILGHHYLPTAGLGGTWLLSLGASLGGRPATITGRPVAAISWWTYEPPEVAFILPRDTPVAGSSWADLRHGGPGGAQEVAERWGARPSD